MKRVVTIFTMALFFVVIMTSCASVPDAKEENGVSYAEDNLEIESENYLENRDEFIEKTAEGYWCKGSLGMSPNVLNINVKIRSYTNAEIKTLIAEPLPDALNLNKVKELLFFNETVNEIENTENENSLPQMETTDKVWLQSEDESIEFRRVTDTGFFYNNRSLYSEYNRLSLNGAAESFDSDISDTYTSEMAEEELKNIIKSITGLDIYITSTRCISNQAEEGYYELEFVPQVDEIPLAVNDREMDTDTIIDVYGNAVIGEKGLAQIEANNFLWKISSIVNEENCLQLGEVMDLLDKYVQAGKIECNEDVEFSRCELVYLATTENWQEAKLTPVWRFYIPVAEMVESGMDAIILGEEIPSDICINAVSGEIELLK